MEPSATAADAAQWSALLRSRLDLQRRIPPNARTIQQLVQILRSEPVLEAEFVILLRELARRSDQTGLSALRGLCHLRHADEEVRDLYAGALERGVEPDEIPCLIEHDERTLVALERALARADEVAPFVLRLSVAGLLDHERSPLARRLAARIPWLTDPEELWSRLDGAGYTGPTRLVPFEPRTRRADKLSIRARTLHAAGRSSEHEEEALIGILASSRPGGAMGPSDHYWPAFDALEELGVAPERMADACLGILLDPEHWSRHVDRACAVLSRAHLDRRQQALLCHAERKWTGVKPLSDLFARQGEACLERVARLRLDPHFELDTLASVLAIARPAPSDLEFLAAALERASADERLAGLALVERHALDAPALREAVRVAARHPEPAVSERARELFAARGW